MQRYSVVFTGRLAPEFSLDAIKNNLSRMYKNNGIDRFFTGQRLILKTGLELEKATRLLEDMNRAGTICQLMAEQVEVRFDTGLAQRWYTSES